MKSLETLAVVYIYIVAFNKIIKRNNSKELCVLTMLNIHSSLPP